MLLADGRDADDQLHGLAAPVDALREGHDHKAGVLDLAAHALNAVGDRQAVADGGVEHRLLVQHCLRVLLGGVAALMEDLSDLADDVFLRCGCMVDQDVLLQEKSGAVGIAGLLLGVLVGSCVCDLVHQSVILRCVHEVRDGDDSCSRSAGHGTGREILVADDQLRVLRNFRNGSVAHFDVLESCRCQLSLDNSRAHSAGAHACVAGEDDAVDGPEVNGGTCGLSLGLGLHILHLGLCVLKICLAAGHADDRSCDDEGDDCCDHDADQDGDGGSLRSHADVCDDGTGGRRAGKAQVEDHVVEHRRDAAADGRQKKQRVHQDVGEVDLVDTAEQVDDQRTGSGILGDLIPGEHPVGQQDAGTCAGVGLDHVEDGFSGLLHVLDAEGSEDTVVDGVVQEQDLRRLHEDGDQRKEVVVHQHLDAAAQDDQHCRHERSDDIEADDHQDEADDADGEVVDKHLKAGLDLAFHGFVKLLDDPACERAHDHGAHQHGVLGAADHTDGGYDADDSASVSADHLTALVSDQDRKNVGKHRADHAAQLLIREPAGGDEQCGEKSPRDECADVRHDHSA